MSEKQKTIKKPFSLSGKGLHTGVESTITIKPAPENHGYKFKRIDLEGEPIIEAIVENAIDTSRSTVLGKNGVKVGTVEHILSAAAGLGIDNLLIEINAPETPILDGSSKHFAQGLTEAGIVEQEGDKNYYEIKEVINYTDKKSGIELTVIPSDEFTVNVMIDYNSEVLGNQYANLDNLLNYKDEISSCKTFVFFSELEFLLDNNLIKGGDIGNALVIVEKEITQAELDRIADIFNIAHRPYKGQGVLNEEDLLYPNEPARHKLLDLIGDLALIGMPIKGKVIATRPGHFSNVEFAKKIKQQIKKDSKKAPAYDPNIPPVYDINDIKTKLPHRPPFLLVDKILEISDTRIVGLKCITVNEPFFIGHFPEEPVMPGVLIIEAMAQVGGVLVLNSVADPENYSTYFLKIDKARFKKKVVPGDTVIFELELLQPIRRGIANMKARAFVGDTVVAEAELLAQIAKTVK